MDKTKAICPFNFFKVGGINRSQSTLAYYLNIFCFTIYGHGGHFSQVTKTNIIFILFYLLNTSYEI